MQRIGVPKEPFAQRFFVTRQLGFVRSREHGSARQIGQQAFVQQVFDGVRKFAVRAEDVGQMFAAPLSRLGKSSAVEAEPGADDCDWPRIMVQVVRSTGRRRNEWLQALAPVTATPGKHLLVERLLLQKLARRHLWSVQR